jgi:hypothetical protein
MCWKLRKRHGTCEFADSDRIGQFRLAIFLWPISLSRIFSDQVREAGLKHKSQLAHHAVIAAKARDRADIFIGR